MRGFKRLALGLCLIAGGAWAEPARVVSINLCTDQLAMMLADPGQLVAVSYLARDPRSSTMVAQAMAYSITYGRAEEVFLKAPDLVLAGTYTTQATVDLLQGLGVEVALLAPPSSLADVGDNLREVGRLLGHPARGEAMAAAFEADLAALRADVVRRPRAALYYANGYTGGDRSLAGEILVAAGFANVAAEVDLTDAGRLPLEQLIQAAPDTVITGRPYPGNSRAEEILAHPALDGLRRGGAVTDADWVCGTPHVLRAIARLAEERRALEAE